MVGAIGRRVTVAYRVDGSDSQGRWSTGEDGQIVEMGGTGNEIFEGRKRRWHGDIERRG
jgi:hypothetical protein